MEKCVSSEWADISYSKDLAELFPDAEWWWCLYSNKSIKLERRPYNQGSLTFDYPAITIQMALDLIPDYTQKLGNLEIGKCETDHMTMKKKKQGWYNVSYWTWGIEYTKNGDSYSRKESNHLQQDISLVNALCKMIQYLRKEALNASR